MDISHTAVQMAVAVHSKALFGSMPKAASLQAVYRRLIMCEGDICRAKLKTFTPVCYLVSADLEISRFFPTQQ